jgi:hypothetical protein
MLHVYSHARFGRAKGTSGRSVQGRGRERETYGGTFENEENSKGDTKSERRP